MPGIGPDGAVVVGAGVVGSGGGAVGGAVGALTTDEGAIVLAQHVHDAFYVGHRHHVAESQRAARTASGELVLLPHACTAGEVEGMRQVLVSRVEVNLQGAAQAAVWLMAPQEQFGLSELHSRLAEAGFPLDSDGLNELAQRLILSGICIRQGDVFRFSVPLLREAIAALDRRFRIDQLRGGASPAGQG